MRSPLPSLAAAARRLPRLDPGALALLAAGLSLYAIYLGYTGVLDRNPDATTHLLYVRFVADHGALPARGACNVCHHPPFYYLIAGAVLRAARWAGSADPALWLQLLSLSLMGSFVVSASFALERLVPTRPGRLLATALVVFWPGTVINVARIGNDPMVYAISGGVLLSLAIWYEGRSPRALWAAGALAVLGVLTKASAVALVGLVLCTVALAGWGSADRRRLARVAGPVVGLLLAASLLSGLVSRDLLGAAPSAEAAPATWRLPGRVLGSAYEIPAAWRTQRTARFYLSFDLRSYLETPYATVALVRDNEPTYWNHLVKSSLFGTRREGAMGPQAEREPSELARGMNALLLALLGFLVLGQALGARRAWPQRALVWASAGVLLAVGLGFHLLVPYGHHADFRFIYPIVIPLAALYAQGAELAGQRSRGLRILGHGLAGLFVVLSIAYFQPALWHERPSRRPMALPELQERTAPPASAAPSSRRAPLLLP